MTILKSSVGLPTTVQSSHFDGILDYVVVNFAEEVTLEQLADAVGVSRFSLCRYFQKQFGVTPMRWLWMFRALLAYELIAIEPRWSLTDVAFATGFTSSAHFSRFFRLAFKIAPSKHRAESLARIEAVNPSKTFMSFETLLDGQTERIKKAALQALAGNRAA